MIQKSLKENLKVCYMYNASLVIQIKRFDV